MNLGRKPAQLVSSAFEGRDNKLSSPRNTTLGHSRSKGRTRQLPDAEKTSHCRIIPRIFEMPEGWKERFPVLQQARDNLFCAYFDPLRFDIGRVFYNPDSLIKDKSYRKRRSEIREAITTRVGLCLIATVNLNFLIPGKMLPSGVFSPYGVTALAKLAKCTISQTSRALKVYERFGYLTIKERKRELPNGKYISEDAIIEVHPSFFIDLEISAKELARYQRDRDKEQKLAHLKYKSEEAIKEERAQKVTARKEIQKIMATLSLPEVIKKMKSGYKLSKPEKELLKQEMPGFDRSRYDEDQRTNGFAAQLGKYLQTKAPPDG